MISENEGGSLFSKYKKVANTPEVAPKAPGPAKQPSTPPPPEVGQRVDNARFAELEAIVNNLKNELAVRKEVSLGSPLPPPPLPPPGISMRELVERLERSEAVIEGLRKELAAQKDITALSLEQAASKDALKTAGQKITDLASSMEDIKRAVASGGELVVRLERSENAAAELKTLIAAQQAQFNKSIAGLAQKNLVSALEEIKQSVDAESSISIRLERSENLFVELKTLIAAQQAEFSRSLEGLSRKEAVDAFKLEFDRTIGGVARKEDVDVIKHELALTMAAVETMKKNYAEYAGEFSRIEAECRKSLGEMQGHTRNIDQKFVGDGFTDYLKDSVSRLNAKLAEVETGMHASLSDMSGRLTMNEVLFKKVFSEAEDRVKKSVEPEMKDMEGQIKWLRDNLIRLSDDYTVVAERKMRALEGKYSAFEVIARRMDAIDAALKKRGGEGLPSL